MMEIQCKICKDKIYNRNCVISRHIKKHNIELTEYIKKFYNLIGSQEFKNCSFCENLAKPEFEIYHHNQSYMISYRKGFRCDTIECKKKISLDILGIEYDSKKFEKIGSKKEYLSKLYNITIEESKKMKYSDSTKRFDNSLNSFIEIYGENYGKLKFEKRIESIINKKESYKDNLIKCDLEGFINKYGIEIGENKYKERCEKISYSNTLDFFTNKYGTEIGKLKFKNKYRRIRISKKSEKIKKILDNLKIEYISEKIFGTKSVDYYLPTINIVIEYYGDYWHCNPKKYESSYIHPQINLTAKEIWEKDINRLNIVLEKVDSVIVIWEESEIDELFFNKIIKDIQGKKTVIYI